MKQILAFSAAIMIALILMLALSPTLKAQDLKTSTSKAVKGDPASEPPKSTTERNTDFRSASRVPDEKLAEQSGGESITADIITLLLTNLNMKADTSNNALTNSSTGSNYLSGNAFSDSNGLNTVFQVTGNMNVLQSSYVINVTISR